MMIVMITIVMMNSDGNDDGNDDGGEDNEGG